MPNFRPLFGGAGWLGVCVCVWGGGAQSRPESTRGQERNGYSLSVRMTCAISILRYHLQSRSIERVSSTERACVYPIHVNHHMVTHAIRTLCVCGGEVCVQPASQISPVAVETITLFCCACVD